MIYLNICPRCGGDVQTYEDLDGLECRCLQCGRPVDASVLRLAVAGKRSSAA